MKRYAVAKLAKMHSLNAVNKVQFCKNASVYDPFRTLAIGVIFQAAVDKITRTPVHYYWYRGQQVCLINDMSNEDYRFYADIAGIDLSWLEFQNAVRKNLRICKKIDIIKLCMDN